MDSGQSAFQLNAPNVLTLARFGLVPVFLAFLLLDAAWAPLVALGVFVVASLTDAVDGYLARRSAQVTTFGKFADPLADKLLMTAAWIAFVATGNLGVWTVWILIGREFLVTGLRILAVTQGIVLAAGTLGKLKTFTHILLVILILVGATWGWSPWLSSAKLVFVGLALLTSVVSGGQYFYQCRQLFSLR